MRLGKIDQEAHKLMMAVKLRKEWEVREAQEKIDK